MEMYRYIQNSQRIRCLFIMAFLIVLFKSTSSQDLNDELYNTPGLPTVTVRGFLNFKTTVDGTVIVFTPASDIHHPATKIEKTHSDTYSSSLFSSDDFNAKQLSEGIQDLSYASPLQNSLENIQTVLPNMNLIENKMKEPFLQHISDNAVLPSTGNINNDLDKMKKNPASLNPYPTGLVTVLGGTFVEGTSTTVYETKVIGTYIDGKYAQILQSSSHIVSQPNVYMTISPTFSSFMTDSLSRSENSFSGIVRKSILPHSISDVAINLKAEATKSLSSNMPPKSSISSIVSKSFTNIPTKSSMSSILSKSITSNLPTKSSLSQLEIKSLTSVSSKPLTTNPSTKTFTIISTPTLNIPVITKSISSREEIQKSDSNPRKELHTSGNLPISPTNKHNSFRTYLESSFITKSVTVSFDNEHPTESLESVARKTFAKPESPLMITSTLLDDDPTAQKNHRSSTSQFYAL